jgi:hypothetical protein
MEYKVGSTNCIADLLNRSLEADCEVGSSSAGAERPVWLRDDVDGESVASIFGDVKVTFS